LDDQFKVPEPRVHLAPIRRAYFSKRFWEIWDALFQRDRDAYLLGWIAEVEGFIRRLERRLERIEHREEDDSP
jgi:hypothetical protein